MPNAVDHIEHRPNNCSFEICERKLNSLIPVSSHESLANKAEDISNSDLPCKPVKFCHNGFNMESELHLCTIENSKDNANKTSEGSMSKCVLGCLELVNINKHETDFTSVISKETLVQQSSQDLSPTIDVPHSDSGSIGSKDIILDSRDETVKNLDNERVITSQNTSENNVDPNEVKSGEPVGEVLNSLATVKGVECINRTKYKSSTNSSITENASKVSDDKIESNYLDNVLCSSINGNKEEKISQSTSENDVCPYETKSEESVSEFCNTTATIKGLQCISEAEYEVSTNSSATEDTNIVSDDKIPNCNSDILNPSLGENEEENDNKLNILSVTSSNEKKLCEEIEDSSSLHKQEVGSQDISPGEDQLNDDNDMKTDTLVSTKGVSPSVAIKSDSEAKNDQFEISKDLDINSNKANPDVTGCCLISNEKHHGAKRQLSDDEEECCNKRMKVLTDEEKIKSECGDTVSKEIQDYMTVLEEGLNASSELEEKLTNPNKLYQGLLNDILADEKETSKEPEVVRTKLKKLKRKDLEDMIIDQLVNKILYDHELGNQRELCKRLEQTLEVANKKAMRLTQEVESLKNITTKVAMEHKRRKSTLIHPTKVKRSVGIQANKSYISQGFSAAFLPESDVRILTPTKYQKGKRNENKNKVKSKIKPKPDITIKQEIEEEEEEQDYMALGENLSQKLNSLRESLENNNHKESSPQKSVERWKHSKKGRSIVNGRPPSSDHSSAPARCKKNEVVRHPAPLPSGNCSEEDILQGKVPPGPTLRVHLRNKSIILSWNINTSYDEASILSYQLFSYEETKETPSTQFWQKIGSVKALELPMACTLTQFKCGRVYHFAVRAITKKGKMSPFSQPKSLRMPLK